MAPLTWGTCTASGRTVRFSPPDGDRWHLIANAPSIAVGYNLILQVASGPVVLVHDDVTIGPDTRTRILEAFDDGADVVGQVGSVGHKGLAWWEGDTYGTVNETRGWLDLGPASHPNVDQIDGLLIGLSSRVAETFRFDVRYVGWHGYDADLCAFARAAGWRIDVADLGVTHHTKGGYGDKPAWDAAEAMWHHKWKDHL